MLQTQIRLLMGKPPRGHRWQIWSKVTRRLCAACSTLALLHMAKDYQTQRLHHTGVTFLDGVMVSAP